MLLTSSTTTSSIKPIALSASESTPLNSAVPDARSDSVEQPKVASEWSRWEFPWSRNIKKAMMQYISFA